MSLLGGLYTLISINVSELVGFLILTAQSSVSVEMFINSDENFSLCLPVHLHNRQHDPYDKLCNFLGELPHQKLYDLAKFHNPQ